jgi:hypothetical protein
LSNTVQINTCLGNYQINILVAEDGNWSLSPLGKISLQ